MEHQVLKTAKVLGTGGRYLYSRASQMCISFVVQLSCPTHFTQDSLTRDSPLVPQLPTMPATCRIPLLYQPIVASNAFFPASRYPRFSEYHHQPTTRPEVQASGKAPQPGPLSNSRFLKPLLFYSLANTQSSNENNLYFHRFSGLDLYPSPRYVFGSC